METFQTKLYIGFGRGQYSWQHLLLFIMVGAIALERLLIYITPKKGGEISHARFKNNDYKLN